MGLYLCILDEDEELDGVEVGPYAEFNRLRDRVTLELEGGAPGSRFPTLILHSDCDGEWSPLEAAVLERELNVIADEFRRRPPLPVYSDWQRQVASASGTQSDSLYDSFFDVNGEPLLRRLADLARLSQGHGLPILFQ